MWVLYSIVAYKLMIIIVMSSSGVAKQLLLNIMITHGSLIYIVFAFQYT